MNQNDLGLNRFENEHNQGIHQVEHRKSNEKTNDERRIFRPAVNRARRGGARSHDRHFFSANSLPKRTINFDLAESFMDHSTNPLSSELYRVRFKHSTKRWPNGRFAGYKEKLDRLDGKLVEVTSKKVFPVVQKRKAILEQKSSNVLSTNIVFSNPIVDEKRKQQAEQQTQFYSSLFAFPKIPRLQNNTSMKRTLPPIVNASSAPSISLLD